MDDLQKFIGQLEKLCRTSKQMRIFIHWSSTLSAVQWIHLHWGTSSSLLNFGFSNNLLTGTCMNVQYTGTVPVYLRNSHTGLTAIFEWWRLVELIQKMSGSPYNEKSSLSCLMQQMSWTILGGISYNINDFFRILVSLKLRWYPRLHNVHPLNSLGT